MIAFACSQGVQALSLTRVQSGENKFRAAFTAFVCVCEKLHGEDNVFIFSSINISK